MGLFEENAGVFFALVLVVGAIGGMLERRIARWFAVRRMKETYKPSEPRFGDGYKGRITRER